MRHLRHPTVVERATVTPEVRMIVEAEHDAPAGAIRRVRLVTPPAPTVCIAIDVPTPAEAGLGRTYKLVQLPVNFAVSIWLQSHQVIYAAIVPGEGGMAMLGYICEYWDEVSA